MSPSGPISVRRVAADDAVAHEAAVDVIRRGFFPREAISIATGVVRLPEVARQLLDLVRTCFLDGMSMAAYDGDVMVGIAVNKLQVKPATGQMSFFERFAEEKATHPSARFYMDFMMKVDSAADLFAEAGTDRLVELMFLGVMPEASRRGIGVQLAVETVQLAKQLQVRGVNAIWSSDYSRAVGKKLGFQELAVIDHASFRWPESFDAADLPAHQKQSILALLKLE